MTEPALFPGFMPGRSQRIAAFGTMVVLLLTVAAVLPWAAVNLAPNPGFLLGFGTLSLFGNAMTSVLIFSHAQAARDRSMTRLAVAYLFAAAMILPYLLQIPGIFGQQALLGSAGGAFWLWGLRNAGFAACVASYAWRSDRAGKGAPHLGLLVCGTFAAVLAAIGFVDFIRPLWPVLHLAGRLDSWTRSVLGSALLACNIAALAVVLARLRSRNVVSIWLAVTMVASCLEVMIMLTDSQRFTLGWYAGKLLDAGTACIVLVALMFEFNSLVNRIVGLNIELLRTAFHDDLTNLPNRAFFQQSLAAAIMRDRSGLSHGYAVMFIDLDRFKQVNDALGHHAGDLLLVEVAWRLKSCLRPQDIVARIGGDEFAVLIDTLEKPNDAQALARRICRTMRRPMRLQGCEVQPSCSIGLVHGDESYQTPDELLRDADCAMYRSKRRRPGSVTVFSPEILEAAPALITA